MDPNAYNQQQPQSQGYPQAQQYQAPPAAAYPQQPAQPQASISPNIGSSQIDPTHAASPAVAPPIQQGYPQQQPQPPQQQYVQQAAPQQPAQQQAPQQQYQPHHNARHMSGRAGGYKEEESQSHGVGKDQENANSTQNMLQFAEIRDGLVIMEDGSFRAVVMAQSINFDLMSQEERESVEYGYQAFLNSLHFDVQIQIKSRRVDLRNYISKLEGLRNQQDNMLLSYLMDDYIEYISYISQESNIMDKQFFIVVPYYSTVSAGALAEKSKGALGGLFGGGDKKKGAGQKIRITEKDLAEAKGELKNRTSSVINGLMQIGIQSIALDTEELAELFYISYNPDTAVRQQINNYEELTGPAITKGQGENPRGNGGLIQ